jgi:hypothetical protein
MTRIRNPRLLLAALGVLLVLAAIPVTAFVIIPQFAQSTLHEPAPVAASPPQPSPAQASPTTGTATSTTPIPTGPRELASGQLRRIDAVHYGTGRVSVIEAGGTRYVRFEDVEIAAAPNLYVYLSDRRDGATGSYVDLGPLKATRGSFNQEITGPVDLSKTGSVVLWCRAFNVTVTYAALEIAQG